MPQSKKQGILLHMDVRLGRFAGESWLIALERLPLGFLVGIICDLCICTPLSFSLTKKLCKSV